MNPVVRADIYGVSKIQDAAEKHLPGIGQHHLADDGSSSRIDEFQDRVLACRQADENRRGIGAGCARENTQHHHCDQCQGGQPQLSSRALYAAPWRASTSLVADPSDTLLQYTIVTKGPC